jgi:dCMP deaminase
VVKISEKRPTLEQYFMEIATVVAKRSTCLRHKNGAVLVKNNHILSTGYNGAPTGLPHCEEEGGCLRAINNIPSGERHELCRGAHAEANAIIQAAIHGISTEKSIMYTTHHPCVMCTKLLINAKIGKVIYKTRYPDKLSTELLKKADVEIRQYSDKESRN